MLCNLCKQQVLQGLIQLGKHLRDAIYQSFATLGKNYFAGDWELSWFPQTTTLTSLAQTSAHLNLMPSNAPPHVLCSFVVLCQ